MNNDGFASAINYMIKTEKAAGYCAGNHFSQVSYAGTLPHRVWLIQEQIVWRTTTRVGMGMATDANGQVFVVARYQKPGNWPGQCANTAKQ